MKFKKMLNSYRTRFYNTYLVNTNLAPSSPIPVGRQALHNLPYNTSQINYITGGNSRHPLRSTNTTTKPVWVKYYTYMNMYVFLSAVINPFLIKLLYWVVGGFDNLNHKQVLLVFHKLLRNSSVVTNTTHTNLLPHKSFNFYVKKKLMNFFADQSMRLNLVP